MRTRIPTYRMHRATGQAVVTLNGKDHYLGRHATPESQERYQRLIAEWCARGCSTPVESRAQEQGLTVADLVARYWQHAELVYRKPDGTPSSELDCLRVAFRPLVALYGSTPAVEFGPKAIKAVRQFLIQRQLVRTTVNGAISRIKRAFRWATGEELFPGSVYHAIQAVEGLRAHRSEAREPNPVHPVAWEDVEAVLPFVSSQVATAVMLQWYTGARSGEVLGLRPRDVNRETETWIFTPDHHKTAHLARARTIPLGPKARELLRPFLDRVPPPNASLPLFAPLDAELERHRDQRVRRRTTLTPSQRRRQRSSRPARAPGTRYDNHSYRRAIVRGIAAANAARARGALILALGPIVPAAVREKFEQGIRGISIATLEGKERTGRLVEAVRRIAARLGLGQSPGVPVGADELHAVAIKALACVQRIGSWHPHQLRHSAATRIRREHGIDAARALLGHSSPLVTAIYAELDSQIAVRIMESAG